MSVNFQLFIINYELFGFLMRSMCFAERTKLFKFQLVRNSPFILSRCIVALLAVLAGKRNDISHFADPNI